MAGRIVVVLRTSADPSGPGATLKELPPSARLEPLFTLPPARSGEPDTLAEMRRTLRVTLPAGADVDVDDLVRKLKADPLVETAYLEDRRIRPTLARSVLSPVGLGGLVAYGSRSPTGHRK